jgi:pyruvate/2-oxoglutarate dehydrogenase complex dihydrolipoamide acyltransferase (E2) component
MAAERTPSRKLDWAEKWVRDGLELSTPPAFFESLQVDMTESRALIERARVNGVRLTYAAILVCAAVRALEAHPDLHVILCGGRQYFPKHADVAVSMASEGPLSPVVVLENAGAKNLAQVTTELAERVEAARAADAQLMLKLRRWGWLLPVPILRKMLLRYLYRSLAFRRNGSGTFQVSIVPHVDYFFTPVFGGSAVLTAGRVADRVIAVNGAAVVRPTIFIACCADHRAWNGSAAERFLRAVKERLEAPDAHV